MNLVPSLPIALVAVPLLAAATALKVTRPARWWTVGVALAELALATAALAAAGAGPPLAARLSLGSFSIGVLLDRLAALTMLLVAIITALAAASAPVASDPGRARPDAALQLVFAAAALACFAANVALAALAYLAVAWLASRTALPTTARLVNLGTAVAFAAALACIYAAAGTFDAAALSRLAPAAAGPALLWLQTAAYLLFGALTLSTFALPLALGRPGGADAVPVAARLAALAPAALGAASVLRVYSLEFPCFSAGPCGAVSLALPTGLAVLAGGALALLLARNWRELTSYLVLVLFGMLWIAIGGWRVDGLAAGVYFLPHAVLASAALMLGGELRPHGHRWLFAATLLLAVGVPPTAGFVGVVAILEASSRDALSVWTLLALSTLLAASAMLGLRAEPEPTAPAAAPREAVATTVLLLIAFSAAARPAYDFALATARQLFDRAAYAPPALLQVGSGGGAGHTAATLGRWAPAIEEAT